MLGVDAPSLVYLSANEHPLLDLARRAPGLFRKQVASEKRRLLNFVLSNCLWKGCELTVNYRQPFEMLAVTTRGSIGCSSLILSPKLSKYEYGSPVSSQQHGSIA
jgi:hypothetical protein